MSIIEQIRSEVERRIENLSYTNDFTAKSIIEVLDDILIFLDTLQEQPVCEDVEKELERFLVENVDVCVDDDTDKVRIFDVDTGKGDIDITYTDLKAIARHFYELGRQSKCVKVKAESALDKFILENCTHCTIEHCPGEKECYTSSNKQLQ